MAINIENDTYHRLIFLYIYIIYMNKLLNIKTGIDASYKDNETAKRMLSKQGFSLDEQLSGQRAKVFVDGIGKPHVVFRGTSNKHDMITDALIARGWGNKTNRVKHSKKVMKEVETKYNQPGNAIGHSLGGYLAQNSGAKGKITTYNKASTGVRNNNPNQTDIRTDKDIISILTRKDKNNVTLKSKSWNPFVAHSTRSLKDKNVTKGKFI
jgi:hypothetical protein